MANENPRKYRRRSTTPTTDAGLAENNSYNDHAGVRKTSDFGKALQPFQGGGSYTTVFTTAKELPIGTSLAVYNNAGAVASITFSDAAIASLAAGATDASGNVGIPLAPNSWTYLNNYNKKMAITSAATVLVFIIQDDTNLVYQQA